MMKPSISIMYVLCTLILTCFNHSFTSQKKTPIPQKNSSDTTKTSSSDEQDYIFTNLIEEGYLFFEYGFYNDAIKKFNEANKIKESSNAYKGLGMAYIQKAKNLDKKMATLIRAVRKKNYFESSVKSFLKAISFEPNNLEIRYLLTDAFIFRNNHETYEMAKTLLEQIVSTDKSYKDALIRLSIVYRHLGKQEKSREALNEYLKMKEGDSRALYQLSKIAVEEDKFEESVTYFLQSLDNLTDEKAISEILEHLEILFSSKDQEEFRLAEHKGRFFKKFWLLKDPDPETEVNERLVEHFKRVKFANKNFTTQSTHGKYDDRGRTYIKYGEPDYKDMGGGGLSTYSNEYWEYYWGIGDYNYGFVYNFANKGGWGYELIGDSSAATSGAGFGLFKGLSPKRREIGDSQYKILPEGLRGRYDDYRDAEELMYKNAPAEAYVFHTENQPLPVMTSSASFRGKDGKTRQELYYSFPLKGFKFKKTDKYKTSVLDELVILKNIDNKILFQNKQGIELKYEKQQNLKKDSYIGQINIEIPYQDEDYIGFLKIKSTTDDRLGLLYHDLTNKDYIGESFMISDIEFAYNIVPTTKKDQFTKSGLCIIPHTGGILNKNESIFIYFEVYNLTLDADGDGRYNVEYIVQKRHPEDKEKKKYFNALGKEISNKKDKFLNYFVDDFEKESITISRVETTKQRDTFNWLSFDIKALSEGLYDLTVKITDLVSNESTSSEYQFIIGEK